MDFWSFLVILLLGINANCFKLETVAEWSSVQFQYDNKEQEKRDLKTGKYVPSNIVVLAANVYKGKNKTQIFVTTPDFISGTPFTLSLLTNKTGAGGPILKPFPSASSHKVPGDCNSLTNVWRTQVDNFGRLWVIDNGKENTLRKVKYVCPPQILIYDLNNKNKLIRRYKVPGVNPMSVLANVKLEHLSDKPEDVVGYFNDEFAYSLVVYSFKNNTSFVIKHPYFSPDPYKYPFFDLNGSKFYLMIGIDGVAIGPKDENGKRTMYFHPLTSGKEGAVSTDILRDASKTSYSDFMSDYKLIGDRGFHSAVQVITDEGTMIFSNIDNNSIVLWNISQPYGKESFLTLIQDTERLQFPTFLQIVKEDDGDYLYVVTDRLQLVVVGTPAKNEINSRILRGKLTGISQLTLPKLLG